ncbi:MAG: OmpA family protein [Bacteroidota bacterium]
MRYLLQLALLAGLVLYILYGRYYYVCMMKDRCNEPTEIVTEARPQTLTLRDGSTVILDNYEQFAFGDQETEPKLSASNTKFLDEVKSYLDANPNKKLKITGLFRESEVGIKSGFYDNLGIARASKIKQLLEARGVNGNRISIDYNKISGNRLLEPVTFALSAASPSEYGNDGDQLAEMKFEFKNMTFTEANFDFDSDVFKPGGAFTSYADSVRTYLGINAEQTLTIIGHTDNVGTDSYNDDLGLRRAKSVREYFRGLGLEAKINVGTKGEKEPVAPNNSDANKQKNRRVNVLIE